MSQDKLPPLQRAYLNLLVALHESGGSGALDQHGRVVVGPTRHPLAGQPLHWLVLVSRGLVAGERGLVIVTEAGREEAERVIAGRVREAS